MRKLPSPLRWQVFALVEATSVFGVLDNMRYDRACPLEERDARILEDALSTLGDVKSIAMVVTKFVETKPRGDGELCWTLQRWNGGGIRLTPISSERAHQVERGIKRHDLKIARWS